MIVFSLLLLVAGGQGRQAPCTQIQARQLQQEFRGCSRGYTEDTALSTCQLVTNIVDTCGEQWKSCHGPREVQQMRDMHISALVQQYGQEELSDCRVVREFSSSGRLPSSPSSKETPALCSDPVTREAQLHFQNCSHAISTRVYEATQLLTSPGPVTEHLCRAITDIGSRCVSLLNKCFAQEDVIQMKRSNLETMKTFLIRIVDGKVEDNALDRCPGLLEDEEVEEQEEYIAEMEEQEEVSDKKARQELLEEIRKEEILEEEVEDSVTAAVTDVVPAVTESQVTESLARTKEGRSARQEEEEEEGEEEEGEDEESESEEEERERESESPVQSEMVYSSASRASVPVALVVMATVYQRLGSR